MGVPSTPLSNARLVRRILKKSREAWEVFEGDLDGRAMVEIRLVHESGGQWVATSTVQPFRYRAELANQFAEVMAAVAAGCSK